MLSFGALSGTSKNARSQIDSPGFTQAFAYLRKRGIDEKLLDPLHIHICPARELWNLLYKTKTSQDDRMAVVFPHFDFSGKMIEWWSARLVDTQLRPVVSFADVVDKSRSKMTCPPDVPPHAYFPPTLNWAKMAQGDKVYIHESAIKSINGAKFGRYSIGLNGVWGWKSKKHDLRILPEFREIPWKRLELQPVIVFDSNASDNWDVQNAIVQLAATLLDITGRHARHILLPKHGEEHQGFDDFCQRHTDAEVEEYLDSEGEIVEISEFHQMKARLNQEVVVVRSLGRIAEQATGTLMSKQTFTDINYGHYNVQEETENGSRQVNVPRLWLADPRRSEVERIDYVPGGARISSGTLNLWRGLGANPRGGDVGPFLRLLDNNIPDPSLRNWLLQWLAYPLQNLGGKTTTFVHLFGPSGTGKNMLVRPLLRIYGVNAVTIGKEQIESSFNSIYAAKQLIHLDELHGANQATAQKITNKIKMLVTGERIVVNQKGQPEYEVNNHANLITTSNYVDSIKLDDDDRRAAVIKFKPAEDLRHDQVYWQSYVRWCDDEGGAEALLDYLLKLDLSEFNPRAWAPETSEKQLVKAAGKTAVEEWVEMLWENADAVIAPIFQTRALFTAKELATMLYSDNAAQPGQVMALGKALQNRGFEQANDGKLIKVKGTPARYWIIRKREESWTNKKILDHLKLF